MSNEVAPMSAVQEKIKDRIKDEFVGLIPDELWAQMVQSVIRDFTADRPEQYGRGTTPSPLKKLIHAEIEAMCKEQIKAELVKHSSDFETIGGRVVSAATERMIREHTPVFVAAMQAGMTQMMVDKALENMRNSSGLF